MNWDNVIAWAKKGNLPPSRRVEKTEAEWKSLLDEETYRITRLKGTERAGTGLYCESHQAGIYSCICCQTDLFDSTIKYESGSGWPSFTLPIQPNAIQYIYDNSFGMERVEILCNVCDSHLGHVFPDGPQPTGLRYCVNSKSISLKSANE